MGAPGTTPEDPKRASLNNPDPINPKLAALGRNSKKRSSRPSFFCISDEKYYRKADFNDKKWANSDTRERGTRDREKTNKFYTDSLKSVRDKKSTMADFDAKTHGTPAQ